MDNQDAIAYLDEARAALEEFKARMNQRASRLITKAQTTSDAKLVDAINYGIAEAKRAARPEATVIINVAHAPMTAGHREKMARLGLTIGDN